MAASSLTEVQRRIATVFQTEPSSVSTRTRAHIHSPPPAPSSGSVAPDLRRRCAFAHPLLPRLGSLQLNLPTNPFSVWLRAGPALVSVVPKLDLP
jgi:hypothetical protein